jgi:hypothetical protein
MHLEWNEKQRMSRMCRGMYWQITVATEVILWLMTTFAYIEAPRNTSRLGMGHESIGWDCKDHQQHLCNFEPLREVGRIHV